MLTLTNDSLISAPFKTFIKNARSKYRVDLREGVLAPHETTTITVTANLDDTIVHRDQVTKQCGFTCFPIGRSAM